jgi:V/A-type H+-transporting ATPase subunit I
VPTEKTKELEDFLNKESLYYISAAAESEDNPPIKLKNNWYTRLFEPIGDLYMLPRYDELDLTPYFAPFYMLFFGFCLGDMGYGLVFMILGLVGKRFLPKMKGYLNLVFFLGLGSFIMAAFPGVIFGVKVADIIPSVRENNTFLFNFSDMKMFWFAILFGLFQIVFARILTGIDSFIRKGWQHGMAPFGWAILIVWCTIAYASMEVPSLALPKSVSLSMVIVSVSLILFFSKPEGPIYKRLGKGLWAMYDITGVFGDMLSYIRLFGLGTAGAILGMVFNSIAMSLSGVPYVGWLLTVIMLLFGHTLVLALNSLGAFVHPMRLTFVEFYKNAGFTGGGRGYKPLTSVSNNKER